MDKKAAAFDPLSLRRAGVPVVVSAPSGGGKTTMCHRVIQRLKGIEFSVSHTTRAPRLGERAGVDYNFVDDSTFQDLIARDAFLEWAKVHGRLYGTSRQEATTRLGAGTDVFFDIDVQGGRQIVERMPEAVLVFVVPPSMGILEERLRRRRSDSDDAIALRLRSAAQEIREAAFYTHWIVNDSLDEAVNALEAIVSAERLRRVDKAALAHRVLQSASS